MRVSTLQADWRDLRVTAGIVLTAAAAAACMDPAFALADSDTPVAMMLPSAWEAPSVLVVRRKRVQHWEFSFFVEVPVEVLLVVGEARPSFEVP